MGKAPKKKRLVYLICGLVVVAAMVAIGGVIGQSGQGQTGPTETAVPDLVLEEGIHVRLTYTGAKPAPGLDGTALVSFRVENLSDQEFTVYPVDTYVNDTAAVLASGVPATVAPGKSYVYPWTLSYAAIGVEDYDALETLETKFQLMTEDGSVLEELGPFTVELGA